MLASGRAVSGAGHPIKQVGADTGGLFQHLETCQPSLCRTLRVASEASKWQINEDGEVYQLYIFDDLLPHHANSYVDNADARRPVPHDLVGHAAPKELIELDAADDQPGLGVLVQRVRRRLLPRLRRLRCRLSASACTESVRGVSTLTLKVSKRGALQV